MVFCTGCGREIHEAAPVCPQCGKPQWAVEPGHATRPNTTADPIWVAIMSLMLGLLCALALFDESEWDKESIVGMMAFSILGITFGITSLNISKRGEKLAIAGIVMSGIGLIGCLGSV